MTVALNETRKKLMQQQELVAYSAKMSALGEMAGGVAHEINTPLTIISMRTEQMQEYLQKGNLKPSIF